MRHRPGDFLYIALTVMLVVYGQIVMKWQMSRAGPLPDGLWDKARALLGMFSNPWVLSCYIAALAASLSWMVALTRFSLGFAYPFMSAAFALTLLLSALIFRESLTLPRVAGVLLIGIGIWVGSRG